MGKNEKEIKVEELSMTFVWKHPKYYEELIKKLKEDQS
jgi:hypothetical protein